MKFEIEKVDAPQEEQETAQAYWSTRKYDYYKKMQPWSKSMAEKISAYDPRSVFEFGCNAGKNLMAVRDLMPGVFASGVDINKGAVAFGRESEGLRLAEANEDVLSILPERSFDVVFTVSVLDHIATPEPVLAEMCRVSNKAVLLLEPWLGHEGKVVRNQNANGDVIDTTPYSYSWDYRRMARDVAPGWNLDVSAFPLKSNLGPYYELYALTRA